MNLRTPEFNGTFKIDATFCSDLILSDGDFKDSKDMLSHFDFAMTDMFSHLPIAHKRKFQINLAEHYSNPYTVKTGIHWVYKSLLERKKRFSIIANPLDSLIIIGRGERI